MSEETTRAELDEAIRRHVEGCMDNAEVIVGWVVVAATRSLDGGGATVVAVSEGTPRWQAKGLLLDALDVARRPDLDDDADPP